jgi:hypothetical protein
MFAGFDHLSNHLNHLERISVDIIMDEPQDVPAKAHRLVVFFFVAFEPGEPLVPAIDPDDASEGAVLLSGSNFFPAVVAC